MDYLKSLFLLLRFPNLVIAVLTQFMVYQLVLLPALNVSGIDPLLDFSDLSILMLATAAVTAAGYLWNDMVDYPLDCINKPDKVIINNKISFHTAFWIYGILTLSGWGLSLFLALTEDKTLWFFLYPSAVGGLVWYSQRLKKSPFWGNLLVSFYCAGVPALVWLAERESLLALQQANPANLSPVNATLVSYLLFAFLSTLFREMVKDLEDMEGDSQYGLKTLPLVLGIPATHRLLWLTGMFLLLSVGAWGYVIRPGLIGILVLCTGIALPMLYNLWQLFGLGSRQKYHRISTITKGVMLAGLFLLVWTHYFTA